MEGKIETQSNYKRTNVLKVPSLKADGDTPGKYNPAFAYQYNKYIEYKFHECKPTNAFMHSVHDTLVLMVKNEMNRAIEYLLKDD